MGSNSFGNIFKITTWGESHGKAIGVVIDGCPAGLELSEKDIQLELDHRSPGKNPYTSPRKEVDTAEIVSGLFEGKTTGAPLSILIRNQDSDSTKYEPIKDLLRPGHANFTYLEKYGLFDYRGGGRASGRETACRVAAGSIAKKLLRHHNIDVVAYLKEAGGISMNDLQNIDIKQLKKITQESPIFCPDQKCALRIMERIEEIKLAGDSIGGIVEFVTGPLPTGLGDPVYEKLEANLAKAMLSIPATKGFEIGSGFGSAKMKGSQHNDTFRKFEDKISLSSNFAGGTLGGISTGMPLVARVAFKPTSSILMTQQTTDIKGDEKEFQLPEGSRHDPCIAIRATSVVEAMGALVLIDALLMKLSSRLVS
jgi:chorismate synthase